MTTYSRLLLTLFFVLVCVTFLLGQNTYASITGKVFDINGEPIRDVLVTATNSDTGAETTRNSDKRGKFRFMSVVPGPYQLKFEKEGYKTHTVMCVMNAEQSVSIKAELKKEEPQT